MTFQHNRHVVPIGPVYNLHAFRLSKNNLIDSVGNNRDQTISKKNLFKNFFSKLTSATNMLIQAYQKRFLINLAIFACEFSKNLKMERKYFPNLSQSISTSLDRQVYGKINRYFQPPKRNPQKIHLMFKSEQKHIRLFVLKYSHKICLKNSCCKTN